MAIGIYYTLLKKRKKQGEIREHDKGDRNCRLISHLKLEDSIYTEGRKTEEISIWKMPGRPKY